MGDTNGESSHEQGSEKANARRKTTRIKGKKDIEHESECSDDENSKVVVKRKIGRPKGSFKKVLKIKDGEDEDEDESKANPIKRSKVNPSKRKKEKLDAE